MQMTKERPILFSAPMVRAILEGHKTQTRRIIKPQPGGGYSFITVASDDPEPNLAVFRDHFLAYDAFVRCPYGKPGDRLWVRETFYCDHTYYPDGAPVSAMWREVNGERKPIPLEEQRKEMLELMYYRATDCDPSGRCYTGFAGETMDCPWRPSIHMPRWASRILLEVTAVRVERLQEIRPLDAVAEGITRHSGDTKLDERWADESYVAAYRDLWESINGTGSWDANPWVWAISFKAISATVEVA